MGTTTTTTTTTTSTTTTTTTTGVLTTITTTTTTSISTTTTEPVLIPKVVLTGTVSDAMTFVDTDLSGYKHATRCRRMIQRFKKKINMVLDKDGFVVCKVASPANTVILPSEAENQAEEVSNSLLEFVNDHLSFCARYERYIRLANKVENNLLKGLNA